MKPVIYFAATVAAVLAVLSTRLLIPALILCFKGIEAGFSPDQETSSPVLVAVPTEPAAPKKPRKARRRKPSAQTLAAIEAIA